jgi:uncharacterized protein YciI
MLYTFFLLDSPGVGDLRSRIRPEHKAYLAKVAERIAFAGPLLAEDGKSMLGSLLVIEFPSRDDALSWLRDEPFTRAGVYGSQSICGFENLWSQRVGFPSAGTS